MANILGIVWFIIGLVTFHTSLTVWAALMLPAPVERARRRQQQKPVASFFTGVGFVLVTAVVASVFLRQHNPGLVQLLGWLLAAPVLIGYIIGGAALARLVQPRIRTEMSSDSGILALVGAALCTSLAGWFPIIGWVLFAPVTLFINVGSGVLALINRREAAPRPVPQPGTAPAAPAAPPAAPAYEFALPPTGTPAPAAYADQYPQQG